MNPIVVTMLSTGNVFSISKAAQTHQEYCKGQDDEFFRIFKGILKEMTNLSLLKENNIPLYLMVMCNFLYQFGFYVPLIYMPIIAKELNIPNVTLLIGIIGKM